ncbi:MAG: hypothetical protein D6698_02490 [Gammaproteobacteria bacterium]|nr:MAG: hypothetical protein D6698_02490 [Gammaproteobacteria bacterium]
MKRLIKNLIEKVRVWWWKHAELDPELGGFLRKVARFRVGMPLTEVDSSQSKLLIQALQHKYLRLTSGFADYVAVPILQLTEKGKQLVNNVHEKS